MTGSLSRGASTFNATFIKSMMRKSYHKKGGGGDMIHGEIVKSNVDEAPTKSMVGSQNDTSSYWVPHDRTGIYYPKGQEKVMDDVPVGAGKHIHGDNWFSNKFDA